MQVILTRRILHFTVSAIAAIQLCSCSSNATHNSEPPVSVMPALVAKQQDSATPAEVKTAIANELAAFIPQGYEILDTAYGDINLDKLNDCILVLKDKSEDSSEVSSDTSYVRPLLLLLRSEDNSLKLAKSNDMAVYGKHDGGMMGDPYVGITIKNGLFSIENYGGSGWRWTRVITFKYSPQDQQWYLFKDGSDSYHAGAPEQVESEIKTEKDFGVVKFEDFDCSKIE
jgi:hypothetical protein